MGEEDWRVHTVGFPAIDLIHEGKYAKPDEVVNRLGLDLTKPVVLFTQHSVTTEFDLAVAQVRPSLAAMKTLASEGVEVVVTYPNNDAGGRAIIEEIEKLNRQALPGLHIRASLGRHLYHGVLALALNARHRVSCVGNSSSGIKETPAFGCPTVNIGSRQLGRLRAENVLDADYDEQQIHSAVHKCLYYEAFRAHCSSVTNPYGLGDAGVKIADVLSKVTLDRAMLRKRMTLVGEVSSGWYR